jgi:hypothetical protein
MDSIRVSEAPDTGSIPVEATTSDEAPDTGSPAVKAGLSRLHQSTSKIYRSVAIPNRVSNIEDKT